MSDFRALAGVSATLQALLRDRMELPAGVALNQLLITISTPHAENAQNQQPATESPRVNLFMYQVTENGYLKNQDLRASAGAYGSPPLSLNAHYLITGYGATQEANSPFVNESLAQQLLGSAMRVLHDFSAITDSLVTVRAPAGQTILHASLRREFEKIKICLDPLSLEDLTKVWTSLTIPYRLSAAYSVSVVQIESRRQRRFPQLVGEPINAAGPMITVVPLQTPYIASLRVVRQGDPEARERSAPYARIGDTLVIYGQNLSGGTVSVSINGTQIRVPPVSAQEIRLDIPDASYVFDGANVPIPADQRLQPGVQVVEVVTTPPNLPTVSARSNQAIMMLTPHIETIAGAGSTLTITGTRLFAPDMEGETLVGQVLFPADAYNAGSSDTEIELTLPDMAQIGPPGTYPVRVRVNGAESIGGVNSVELPLP